MTVTKRAQIQAAIRQPGPIDIDAQSAEIAEDYRKAGEYHAGNKNFTAAAWYLQLYRMYAPDPEPESQDVELDWISTAPDVGAYGASPTNPHQRSKPTP